MVRQKTTESTKKSVTGLSAIQEKAALMMASGESITSIAEVLGVNRTTIYQWQQKSTFRCFFNLQKNEASMNLRNGLFALYDEALNAVKELLKSKNDGTRLKAAMLVIARVEETPLGTTDVKEDLKQRATTNLSWFDLLDEAEAFNQEKYNQLLREEGLEEDSD